MSDLGNGEVRIEARAAEATNSVALDVDGCGGENWPEPIGGFWGRMSCWVGMPCK
jgi:hypothetical protein